MSITVITEIRSGRIRKLKFSDYKDFVSYFTSNIKNQEKSVLMGDPVSVNNAFYKNRW